MHAYSSRSARADRRPAEKSVARARTRVCFNCVLRAASRPRPGRSRDGTPRRRHPSCPPASHAPRGCVRRVGSSRAFWRPPRPLRSRRFPFRRRWPFTSRCPLPLRRYCVGRGGEGTVGSNTCSVRSPLLSTATRSRPSRNLGSGARGRTIRTARPSCALTGPTGLRRAARRSTFPGLPLRKGADYTFWSVAPGWACRLCSYLAAICPA